MMSAQQIIKTDGQKMCVQQQANFASVSSNQPLPPQQMQPPYDFQHQHQMYGQPAVRRWRRFLIICFVISLSLPASFLFRRMRCDTLSAALVLTKQMRAVSCCCGIRLFFAHTQPLIMSLPFLCAMRTARSRLSVFFRCHLVADRQTESYWIFSK